MTVNMRCYFLKGLAAIVLVGSLGACATYGRGKITELQRRKILKHLGPNARREGRMEGNRGNDAVDNPLAARLGQWLFYSRDFTAITGMPDAERITATGCVDCHRINAAFADPVAKSTGALKDRAGKRMLTGRNAPTVLNSSRRSFLFHDGRADSPWAQATKPFENPVEMGSNRLRIYHTLRKKAEVWAVYEKVFGPTLDAEKLDSLPADGLPYELVKETLLDEVLDPRTTQRLNEWVGNWNRLTSKEKTSINKVYANVGKAIAAYEKLLVSRGSKYDQFFDALAAKDKDLAMSAALSDEAQRGLVLFVGRAGCTECHRGPDFTDNAFHFLGLPVPDDGEKYASMWRTGARIALEDEFNYKGEFSDRDKKGTSRSHRKRGKDKSDALKQLDGFRSAAKVEKTHSRPKGGGRFLFANGQVRTPTLRDIGKTAPYMHDGQYASLEGVVDFYSRLQTDNRAVWRRGDEHDRGKRRNPFAIVVFRGQVLRPANLSEEEQAQIVAFMESLEGEPICQDLLGPPKNFDVPVCGPCP